MFAILFSAFNAALGWFVRGVVLKFVAMSVLFFVITEIINAVVTRLDLSPVTNLGNNINNLPASLLYFLGVFRLDVGLPMILSAMLVAFIIRRLPIIG